MWSHGRALIRPILACASRGGPRDASNAPALAQLPTLLRAFATSSSDAEPQAKPERAPDFDELFEKKEGDIGEGKHLADAVHFSVPTAPPGTEHPEPAGAPPEKVKVEPAPGVKTAGAGDGAANVQPEVPPGGISVNPLGAGGGRALHTLRRSFFTMAPRRDVEAHNPSAVAHPGEETEVRLSPEDLPKHGHEAHKAAGEADAAGMRTGAHMNPPLGAAFDAEGGEAPASADGFVGEPSGDAAAAADAPADLIGVAPKMPEASKAAGFGSKMAAEGQSDAAGMATGGGGISPPKRSFASRAGARVNPSIHPTPASVSGQPAAGGARRFSTPGGPDDSMHNPPEKPGWTPADRGETGGRPSVGVDDYKEFAGDHGAGKGAAAPVDAGVVTPHQTGVNVIGGTPIQTPEARRSQPSQLQRETDGMNPDVEERVATGVVGAGDDALGGTKDHADHEWGRSGP